jgi:hypothetical protein
MSDASSEATGFIIAAPPRRNQYGCGYEPARHTDGTWMGVYSTHCQRAHEGERAIGAPLMRFEHPKDGSCPCCPPGVQP